MSTPTTLKVFVPGLSGILAVQFVTLVQVNGHSAPLSQTVLMATGALPLTRATSLLITTPGFTVKLAVFSTAIFEAMLSCACVSHDLRLEFGSSTVKPLATKALYLASSKGPLLAIFRGPFTNSCKARQYMR